VRRDRGIQGRAFKRYTNNKYSGIRNRGAGSVRFVAKLEKVKTDALEKWYSAPGRRLES
jgi:hypothetical protein